MDEKKTSYAGISWELKISEKSLLGCGEGEGGVRNFYFGGVGYIVGGRLILLEGIT